MAERMHFRRGMVAGLCLSAMMASVAAAGVQADGKGMSVDIETPSGKTRLSLTPPEIRPFKRTIKTPGDYTPNLENFEPWPGGSKDKPSSVSISPAKDEDNTQILGAIYRAILPESIVLTSADGKQTFTLGQDFRYEPNWTRIAGLNGSLGPVGGELHVTYLYATQRLDLVQVDDAGKASIKAGKPVMVCPQLPSPDAGHTALAGVYIAPWKRGADYVVAPEDVYPIRKLAPLEPINHASTVKARKLLEEGKELRIAFLGDSVTLGAEAGAWWDGLWTEKNLAYVSRLVVSLRKQYPAATITPIHAAVGATTTKQAPAMFDEKVAAQKPDIVLIAFGLNDAHGPVGGKPNNAPADYKEAIRELTRRAKAMNAEVILISALQATPFMKNGIGERMKDYRAAMIELANEEQVACADVYTAWMQQADAGIPPFSQLHNWNNHPGPDAHAIYSNTLWPLFVAKP